MSWLDEAELEKQRRSMEPKQIVRPTLEEFERINGTLEQCLHDMAQRTWETYRYEAWVDNPILGARWDAEAYCEITPGSFGIKIESYTAILENENFTHEGVPILELGLRGDSPGANRLWGGIKGQFYERVSQLDDLSIQEE